MSVRLLCYVCILLQKVLRFVFLREIFRTQVYCFPDFAFFFWLNVFGQEWSALVPYKFIFGAYLTFSGPTSLHIIIEGTFIQDKSRLM